VWHVHLFDYAQNRFAHHRSLRACPELVEGTGLDVLSWAEMPLPQWTTCLTTVKISAGTIEGLYLWGNVDKKAFLRNKIA
jgi:hypothetical protein